MRISDWSSDVCSSDLALAYLTGGYVFQHGFSYRADPMAAAFLMGSLWLLLSSRLDAKAIIAAALLAALALLTTIKVVFSAPAFRLEGRRGGKECVSTLRFRWEPCN